MTTTDQYLGQATRGLWGQKKRDAVTELRGAIEDKVYRYRLCGLGEVEAEQAALRDLGSPAAIARELGVVHTGPQVIRMTLLLGVAGLLGMRAAAQLPTVHAVPVPLVEACRFDEARLARFSPEDRAMVRKRIARAGGREKYEAACLARSPGGDVNDLLSLADLLAALRASGVGVQSLPGLDAYLQLRLPGQDWQGVNLNESAVTVPAARDAAGRPTQTYFYAAALISGLASAFGDQIRVTGTVNPTLHIGPAHLQLGTPQHPVRATNLYSFMVLDELSRLIGVASGAAGAPRLGLGPDAGPQSGHSRLRVSGPDGTLYALVGSAEGGIEMTVVAAQGGRVALPCNCRALPFAQTDDLKTLLGWARQGRVGLLVYAVDVSNLRRLTLTPVPAAQVTREEP